MVRNELVTIVACNLLTSCKGLTAKEAVELASKQIDEVSREVYLKELESYGK